ncbi:unnamed protein product (macronuclear) [Paramecium tetraurelia]|uniref:Uncharacterized protein n=1 Tax=Paramecium tetraurelia TaxID=5888 RepID=A0BXJ3_PARTE|nr:uncharacterized protein GSPATT00033113001 [Paramecium tetraurelia]CAK63260.1 unnamed protein product [Paramecium tetraurelia]|eukprot:XP_001430658.1 hypothetical protein (macronuclear) [Paramecium tetraurelia strain d4-2]
MIQTQAHLPQEWIDFLEQIKNLDPIDVETVTQYVKVRVNHFPTDQQMTEYYEEVFSKSTSDVNRKKWHQQDKNLLIWCMTKHLMSQNRSELIPNEDDWEFVSKILCVDKTLVELKWISLLHSNLKISPWSKEEDQILIEIANDHYYKNNWTELTIKFNSISSTQRYPKQIRERWNNVLNPNISRSTWTKEEKIKLLQLILNYGKKWSKIQVELNGRSENQIKNQYNGIIRNLKRFNVQESEERLLIKAIIENPDQKLSLTVTQFMSDFLAKKDSSKSIEPTQINQITESQTQKKPCVDPSPLESGITATNILLQEKLNQCKEVQQQMMQTSIQQNQYISTPQQQPYQSMPIVQNQYFYNNATYPNYYPNYHQQNQQYINYPNYNQVQSLMPYQQYHYAYF